MFQPTGHRVLIEVEKLEETSEGGIILADSATRQREQLGVERGKVLALGPTAYLDFTGEPWVKIGDKVCFKRYEGILMDCPDEERTLRVINDDDIFAIVKD